MHHPSGCWGNGWLWCPLWAFMLSMTAVWPAARFIHCLRFCGTLTWLSIPPHHVIVSFWPSWQSYAVLCCRGAGATTGTTGRATMSSTAAWTTWCCSARSTRTPLWKTSRRDTWMTTSLYPCPQKSQLTRWWNISEPSSCPCLSQDGWMLVHSVSAAVSNNSLFGGNAFLLWLQWGGGYRVPL